jgi:uncharacterized protein YecE (DUF72 family)
VETTHPVRIGCSGWSYEHWRDGVFYPSGLAASRRLAFYSSQFDTVELNASFYRLPTRNAAKQWADQTQPGFIFAVKVSRYLTHVAKLADTEKHLALLLERIEPLIDAGKLGPLLWQLPPTFVRDDEVLARALDALPRELQHAFEFRHTSWFADDVRQMLRSHDVALVVADRPELHSGLTLDPTGPLVYVRFHHGSRGRRGNYSLRELDAWARRIRRWARERPVWAYFNNDWEGFAPANAQALATRVSSSSRTTSRSRLPTTGRDAADSGVSPRRAERIRH